MKNSWLLMCSIVLLSGCWSHGPKRVEKDFGLSVRNMIDKQKVESGKREGMMESASPSLGGVEAVKTIERHNEASRKAKAVKRPLVN